MDTVGESGESGKRPPSRMFLQGVVAEILCNWSPEWLAAEATIKPDLWFWGWFFLRNHVFVQVGTPFFHKGRVWRLRSFIDFSPKMEVCFCKSFLSIILNVKVGHKGRRPLPAENFRRFYEKHTLFGAESPLSGGLYGMWWKVVSRWCMGACLQKKTGTQS